MKTFTFYWKSLPKILLLTLTAFVAGNLFAQTVSITSPASGTTTFAGSPITVTATRSASGDFGGSGAWTWTFATTPSTGVSYSVNPGSSSGTTQSTNITFTNTGAYSVTVTVTRANGGATALSSAITINVVTANLWAASAGGDSIAAYSVSAGTWNAGPTPIFDPFPASSTTTAALGRDDSATLATGSFYFMPNTSNNSGSVILYSTDATGGNRTAIDTFDFNGASTTSLGFVRLAIDQQRFGWILAGDGTNLYLAKFRARGSGNTTITLVNSPSSNPLTFSGGGSAANFVNGDLAFASVGGDITLFALANNGADSTFIYTLKPYNAGAASTTLVKQMSLRTPTGGVFTGSVNGVAFDLAGNIYVSSTGNSNSSLDGLYFLDQDSVNTNGTSKTIRCALVKNYTGLTDLATNVFPTTIITPVKMVSFTVSKSGSNAMLDWTTATETNNDHFDIERSTDAINFTKVGSVQGSGSTTIVHTYQFADPINTTAKVLYYRLKQINLDGKGTYSKIVALRLNGMIVKNYTIYPNPFTSDIKLQINSAKETDITIQIHNVAGQLEISRKATLQMGDNVVVLQALEALKPGMHIMKIISDDGVYSEKIMKK